MHEPQTMLPDLYDGEQRSAWSSGMRAITHALLVELALPAGPLLELGCGGGAFLAELRRLYPHRALYGFDLHPMALSYAQRRLGAQPPITQANLERLPFAAETFAAVIALDVLDQRGVELPTALAETLRVLRSGGVLVMRVSALAWLYGAHDLAFNTGVRYSKETLAAALRSAGFTLQRITYANTLLSPPAILLRLLHRWGVITSAPSLQQSPTAERLIAAALRQEAQWIRRRDLPIGLSLYALARKEAT